MLCIRHNITDPYFNLASEEFLLKESDEEYFLLYVDEPCVIIGKHQNAYAEINISFIRKSHIKVARRISGGGAVWHDQGNLNFAFVRNGKTGELVNFGKYMMPVLDFLNGLGLKANLWGKNSIVVNGFKISGNAEHVHKNRVLHHGTLLFNSNLASLEEALQVDPGKYSDRAVKSVRSKTANIADQLSNAMNITQFGDSLMEYIITENSEAVIHELSDSDTEKIFILIRDKYSTWEWNFGYSPLYELNRIADISGNDLKVHLKVEKGIINQARLSCRLFHQTLLENLEKELIGQTHREDIMIRILQRNEFRDIFESMDSERWISLLL